MINFLRESKAFNDSIEDNDLAAGQIALWYALFHQDNKHNWAEWVSSEEFTTDFSHGLKYFWHS